MPYAGMLYFMPLDPIHYIISNVEVMTGEEMGNISSSVYSGSSLEDVDVYYLCNVMDTSLVDICHLLVCLIP